MTKNEVPTGNSRGRHPVLRASSFVIPSSLVLRHWSLLLLLGLATLPHRVLACSACFGASDSNQAKGMNMGIFALLAVVVVVLGGVASFFIYLARRAARGNGLVHDEASVLASRSAENLHLSVK